jgi:uncharacterized membrane protein YcaP (DUF421 family)
MDLIQNWLGLDAQPKDLTFLQVGLRSVIVFVAAIAMLRMGDKRFLSKMTALDAVLGLILASMLARAINGSAPFFPTLGAGFVLVCLHRFFAFLAWRSHGFGDLVKGHADLIIKDGVLQKEAMSANNLTEHDVSEELRERGGITSPEQVKEAYIERSGKVSVIPRK